LQSDGFLLAKLGIAFKAQALEALEAAGFDPYDYSVLALLAEGAREAQSTIADSLTLDPSRVVALLDSLEERGLIARHRDVHDRRRHVVSITPTGKKQLVRLRAIARRAEDEFLAPLDAESRAIFHDQLSRLAAHHDPRCCP
jgi:DNA-binding MarR family transcriptional regulator